MQLFLFQNIMNVNTMNINCRSCIVCHICMIVLNMCFSIADVEGKIRRWYVGRTPPSSFEYSKINGFYPPKQAKTICERDLQCGGFTFKGSKSIKYIVPEVYFFHFINTSSSYLTTDIGYPHWTSYVVGSRDHILISGSYEMDHLASWRRLNRYEGF